jgi:hypothetical protein
MSNQPVRQAVQGVLLASVLVLCLNFVLHAALGIAAPGSYRAAAKNAVEAGTLVERTPLPLATDRGPFRYDFNDCLVLSMLAVRQPEDIISPRRVAEPSPPAWSPPSYYVARAESAEVSKSRGVFIHNTCYELMRGLEGGVRTVAYHRYVHLYVPLAGFGSVLLGFGGYTQLLHWLAILIPVILVALTFKSAESRGKGYLGLGLAYLACSGVYRFSWSSVLGPAEILLSSVMLLMFLLRDRTYLFFAFAGAFAGAIDFLTGLIPSLLVLVLGIAALEGRSWRSGLSEGVVTGAAAIAVILLKTLVVALAFGPDALTAGMDNMAAHSGVGDIANFEGLSALSDRLGLDAAIYQNRLAAAGLAFAKFAYFSDLVGWGSRPIGVLFVLGGPAILAIMAFVLMRRGNPAGVLLFLAIAGVLVWVLLLPSHSLGHALWMQRLPVWLTIILVGCLCAGISRMKSVSSTRGAPDHLAHG